MYSIQRKLPERDCLLVLDGFLHSWTYESALSSSEKLALKNSVQELSKSPDGSGEDCRAYRAHIVSLSRTECLPVQVSTQTARVRATAKVRTSLSRAFSTCFS